MTRAAQFKRWGLLAGVSAVYILALAVFVQRRFNGNVSGLLYVGTAIIRCPEAWYEGLYLRKDQGYDGQFNYYAAQDPFLCKGMYTRTGTDAYRSQRVLFPFLARILSFGQKPAMPYALVFVNLLALLAGTFYVMKFCADQGLPDEIGLLYAFSLGSLICLFRTTTELLYCSLLVASLYYYLQRQRFDVASVLLSFAVLTKELALAAVFGILIYELLFLRRRDAAKWFLMPIAVYALWQIYIYLIFGKLSSGGSYALGHSVTMYPFQGIVDEMRSVWSEPGLSMSRQFIETATLMNILFASALGFWSLKEIKNALPVLAVLYAGLVHVSQSAPPSGNDFFGYTRHSAELIMLLTLLFVAGRRKLFIVPALVSSALTLAAILNYI